MRARAGLAQVLWLLDERAAAIAHAQDLIRLNPNDNQGLRADLARWLMLTNDNAGFAALMAQYDAAAADWLYTKALWLFRTKARAKATRALKEALTANAVVPAYLLGAKALPRTMPAYVGMGDANEAITYVAAAMEEWETTPGALECCPRAWPSRWLSVRHGTSGPGHRMFDLGRYCCSRTCFRAWLAVGSIIPQADAAPTPQPSGAARRYGGC